jgi:hypothetical protein
MLRRVGITRDKKAVLGAVAGVGVGALFNGFGTFKEVTTVARSPGKPVFCGTPQEMHPNYSES